MNKIKARVITGGDNELTFDECYRIKRSLLNLHPEKDINAILSRIPNKSVIDASSHNHPRKQSQPHVTTQSKPPLKLLNKTTAFGVLDNELQYSKSSSIDAFASLIQNKTDSEINQILPQKLTEYQQRIQLIVDKADQLYNTSIQQLATAKEKNFDLTNQRNLMLKEEQKLNSQLEETNSTIRKLNLKFDLFNDLKPLFEVLISEFETSETTPETIPQKIVNDIKTRRKEEALIQAELNQKDQTIKSLQQTLKDNEYTSRQNIEALSGKLNIIDKDTKKQIEQYQQQISSLQDELECLVNHKNTNIKLHNMLIQIYNLFFPKLNLERDLTFNYKNLELQSSDYIPRTFDEEEIIRYINLMMRNSTDGLSGALLREAIAYSNMMLRDVIKDKVNQVYNPFFVFIEINKLIKEKAIEQDNLNKIISKYQEEQNKDLNTIKSLETQINQKNKAYEILKNKVNKMHKEKEEKSKMQKYEITRAKTAGSKYHKYGKKLKQSPKALTLKNAISNTSSISEDDDSEYEQQQEGMSIQKEKRFKEKFHSVIHRVNTEEVKTILNNNKPRIKKNVNAFNYYFLPKGNTKHDYYKPKTKYYTDANQVNVMLDHANKMFLYKTKQNLRFPPLSAVGRLERKVEKLNRVKGKKFEKLSSEDVSDRLINKIDNIIYKFIQEDKN